MGVAVDAWLCQRVCVCALARRPRRLACVSLPPGLGLRGGLPWRLRRRLLTGCGPHHPACQRPPCGQCCCGPFACDGAEVCVLVIARMNVEWCVVELRARAVRARGVRRAAGRGGAACACEPAVAAVWRAIGTDSGGPWHVWSVCEAAAREYAARVCAAAMCETRTGVLLRCARCARACCVRCVGCDAWGRVHGDIAVGSEVRWQRAP